MTRPYLHEYLTEFTFEGIVLYSTSRQIVQAQVHGKRLSRSGDMAWQWPIYAAAAPIGDFHTMLLRITRPYIYEYLRK